MNLKKKQLEFLCAEDGWKKWHRATRKEPVHNKSMDTKKEWALSHSINAAVKTRDNRAKVYSACALNNLRWELKEDWKDKLRKIGNRRKISEDFLVKKIREIAESLSDNHGRILKKKRMRIGISQKALNLYLKYLWCLGEISAPPHCPLDGLVLNHGIGETKEKWTHLDSISVYEDLIERCRKDARGQFLSLWELENYSKWRKKVYG